jgi:signal transduction histidine kinase
LHILRIFQEAFTNIIKHSEATVIIISTQTKEHQVIVSISDNGHGFSKIDAMADAGRGMNNQKRRAKMIGAQIAWQSGPSGTKLTLTLPIHLAYIA